MYPVYHHCGAAYQAVDTPSGRLLIPSTSRSGSPAATCRCGTPLVADRLLTEAEVIAQFMPADLPAYRTPLAAALSAMTRAEYQTRSREAYHLCGQRCTIDLAFDTRPARFVRTYRQQPDAPDWTTCPRCQRRIGIANVTPANVIKARFAASSQEPLGMAVKRWQAWRRRGVYALPSLKWYERVPDVNWNVATQQRIT
jgi:hypothetical protein